jgi:hypothetical protein
MCPSKCFISKITYETLAGTPLELLLPTVITYETLAGTHLELLLPTVTTFVF